MEKNVWYVTGASRGIGLSLVKRLIQKGYYVGATTRNIDRLIENLGSLYNPDQVLPLCVDLKCEKSVIQSILQTIQKFDKIDVVVNNSGFGSHGTVECLSDEEARSQFDINFFGTLNVIRNVLPFLRTNTSSMYGPRIINISSICGFYGGFSAAGLYSSTKFAIDGLTQSLANEVRPLGIFATCVLPGVFRSPFLDDSTFLVSKKTIPEYEYVNNTLSSLKSTHNNQQGDPEKLVDILLLVSKDKNPPVTLPIGPDSYELIEKRINEIKGDIEKYKDLATSTNFSFEA
ncbi:hypothetical protein CYY_006002 [Polysphondylium violaceum]|uniref:Short-chain dehydrogenase/reductase family protein n=1 Tax=Polysphondylium violaceum TaxID=133409 RepID=A0A8J4PSM4_9MYCE|nr:hypothetical protein CYY_006002 [Polysphondylium violaceum]